MTEKATETLPNPVASFGGDGDKGCVVNYLENYSDGPNNGLDYPLL